MKSQRVDAIVFVLHVVAASCLLGIAVDIVTANVAVEYFTVHHPRVVDSDSPWVMALIWGVGASWWFGLIASALIWWANIRRAQPLPRKRVFRMVAFSMILIWATMMIVLGGVYTVAGVIPANQRRPTFESDRRIIAVAMSHASEYVLGAIVTVVLMIRINKLRE